MIMAPLVLEPKYGLPHFKIRHAVMNSRRGSGRNSNSNFNAYFDSNLNSNSRESRDYSTSHGYDSDGDRHPIVPPEPRNSEGPSVIPISQTESTSLTTLPTIALVTSTTAAGPSTSMPPLPLPTFISSSSPTPLGLLSIYSSADTSSKPMKLVYTQTTTASSPTKTVAALAETAATSSPTPFLELPAQTSAGTSQQVHLSLAVKYLIVVLGGIGALSILIATFYIIVRIVKIQKFAKFRDGSRKGGSKGRYSLRRNNIDYTIGAPPKYRGYVEFHGYPSELKPLPAQRQLDESSCPMVMPPLATPVPADGLSREDLQRRDIFHEPLLQNPIHIEVAPSKPAEQSDTQSFYSQSSTHDQNSPHNPNLINQTNTTPGTEPSGQALQPYDPVQGDIAHLSYLSSLSSGFGDAQIIINEFCPTEPQAQAPRETHRQSRKFSWATSARQDYRDTVYTMASVESAPRFRTVQSWVAQQTGHVERQQQSNLEIPNMPEIPKPLRMRPHHRGRPSEDLAFRQHPGDEIEISRGVRIPSTILDKKAGYS